MRSFRRLAVTAFAVLAATLTMVGPAAAADPVLVYADDGSALPVGTEITATNAGPITFYSGTSGTSGVTCDDSSFTATVTNNDGTATESLGTQTFDDCTTNVFCVLSVNDIVLNGLPYTATVTHDGTVTLTGVQTTVKLSTCIGTITCVYAADNNTVTGHANNADNSITFTNQRFNKVSGPSICFNPARFSGKYSPVTANGRVVNVV